MTEQERVRARDYVNSIRADQPLTGINETETGFDPFGNINRIPGRIRRLFSPNHSSTAMIGGWARSRGRAAGKRTKALLERRLALDKQSSTKFISNNKYVFFPVQYVRESRVTVRSPLYYDLPWLIEFLSRSLPPKYELVIKDHPSQTGALPIDTIRALNRYSQFIHPELNAHKVIKDAAAVITLNNTVGYEALLHGKPVLVLGSAFYDGSNCARSIQKIEKLPSELADAVESGRLSEEKILSFAHCIIEGSYSGTWDDSDQENIDELVDSILAYCDFE